MPSRANRAPGAAQQAITVSRSPFPNAAAPPYLTIKCHSDSSPTMTSAPFALIGLADAVDDDHGSAASCPWHMHAGEGVLKAGRL